MFDPIAHFHRRVGEPIGHWFHTGGWEKISLGFVYLLGLAIAVIVVAVVVDALFGLGIFGDGSCCTGQDPSTRVGP